MAVGTSAAFYYTDFIRRTMSEKKQRDSKYNVSKRTDNRMCDGIVFDYALEMRFYRDAVLPGILSGEITYCERQKEYLLQEGFEHQDKKYLPIKYVADFVLTYKDGHEDVIDVKGMPDHVAPMKRKLLLYKYPHINFYWVAYSKIDGGWKTYEYIQSQRRKRRKEKQKKEKEK